MLEQVHQHIVNELQQSARTDTIFVVTAVFFNLIVLGVTWIVAGEASKKRVYDFVLTIFIALILLVNGIATFALYTGKITRNKLLQGLLSMYRDNNVDKYYDSSLLTNYDKRYFLFTGVILCLAITSIVVPLVIRICQNPESDKRSEEHAEEESSDKQGDVVVVEDTDKKNGNS